MKIAHQSRNTFASLILLGLLGTLFQAEASAQSPPHSGRMNGPPRHSPSTASRTLAAHPSQSQANTGPDLNTLIAAESRAVQQGEPLEITHAARSLNAAALSLLARLRIAAAKPDEAVELCRQALASEPTAERHLEFASILMQTGHASEAIAETDAVLAENPKSPEAWLTRGTLLRDAGRHPEAGDAFRHALELRPSTQIAFALGSALLASHDKAQAQVIFARLLAASGNSAIWHLAIGDAYRDTDYLADAVAEIRAALARDPRVAHGEFFLGLTYLQMNLWGPSSDSFTHLRKAVEQNPHEYISNFYLGALESTDGSDLASSDKHLHVAAEADPTKPEAWLYLGLNANREHNATDAKAYLRKAIELTGRDEAQNNYQVRRAYFALGRLLISEGERSEGEQLLARYKLAERNAVAESGKVIDASTKPGDGEQAANLSASAAALDPSVRPGLMATTTPVQAAAQAAAEGQLRTLLGSTYNDLGTAEARQQQYSAALRDFQQGEHWDPANSILLRNLGVAAFRTDDFAEAARALAAYQARLVATSAALDPKSGLMLALSQFHLGHFADAAKSFSSVDALAMQDPRTAYSYAFSLVRDGHAQEANRIADRLSTEALPADIVPLICHIYIDTENYAGSQTCYRKALAQDPNTPLAHYEIGESLIRLDRPAEAISELQEEERLQPGNPNVQTALAFALLQTSHKDEAHTLLASVTSAHPEHAEGQYEYGKLLLEEGKTAEAITHLELSARADSSKDYTHYQLGTAYRKSGRATDAEREFSSYRAIKDRNRNTNAVPH